MLEITIPKARLWDEQNQQFVYTKEHTLRLEHSLVSLSKWEAKWCKPFFSKQEKTNEETIDYVRCMTITQNVDPDAYKYLTNANMLAIKEYIEAPHTATSFNNDKNKRPSRETPTTELIYYWMITFNIPFECKTWHLNRLLALIQVCEVKNTPPKKTSKKELAQRYAEINAARKKQFNTKG